MRGRPGGWSRVVLAGVGVLLALAPVGRAAAAAPPEEERRSGDPALSVDPAAVARAMVCRGPLDGGGREPVLLVHGTFTTGAENFGWNYLPELAARGYRVCTVDLPNRSIDDIQVAAESVVVAVHRMARESGRQVDVLGHSQGVLQARWALRWWPSVRAKVDDLVSLAGPNQGTTVAASPLMPMLGCASCLQMAPGSAFLTALNAGDQTPGTVSYTAIYSTLVDELITPNATAARIDGASNLELQALCSGRVVTHVSIVADTVAYALAVDAFRRPGPATSTGFDRATCLSPTFVGLPGLLGGVQSLLTPPPVPVVGTVPAVEPPLQPYARAAQGDTGTSTSTSTSTSTPAPTVTIGRRPGSAASAGQAASATAAPVAAASSTGVPFDQVPIRAARSTGASEGGALPLLAGLALVAVAGAAGGLTVNRARWRREPQAPQGG